MPDAPVIASRAGRGRWPSAATTSPVSKVPSLPHSTYRQLAAADQGRRLAMLGHRRDHDVVSAEPEPVGKATDRLGRIAAGPGPVLRDGSGFGSVTTRC